ncbi:MAG TPA: hypothetical protein VKE88_00185, partial [Candidatus Nanoarchaeia archaeon]|nr:hypothetical protein [Candidatus Nanoarchaeia archaeon]
GYIFAGYFSQMNPHTAYGRRRITKKEFLFSILIAGPAVMLHELGHKFVAIAFGHTATFFSAISINKLLNEGVAFLDLPAFLMIMAVVSTYVGMGFFFFIPGYVSFSSAATPFQQFLIAFAGPGTNLMLWLTARWMIRNRRVPHKYFAIAFWTEKINMMLFIFNMIPFPGFDGYKVFSGLFQVLF